MKFKGILVLFFVMCFGLTFQYNIVVDSIEETKDNCFFLKFHVSDKNNNTVLANCTVEDQEIGYNKFFKTHLCISNNKTHILIKCRVNNTVYFLYTPILMHKSKNYSFFEIINPSYIVYNQKNKFDIKTKCENVSVRIGNKIYPLKYDPFRKIFTGVFVVKDGNKVNFIFNCDNETIEKPYSNDYFYIKYPEYEIYISKYLIYDINKPIFLKVRVYNNILKIFEKNLSRFKIIAPDLYLKCKKYVLGNSFIVNCISNKTGNYSLNLCYDDICKKINISIKDLEKSTDIMLLYPNIRTTYYINNSNETIFFRFKYFYKKPILIKELNYNITLKTDNRTFYGYLPLHLGKNEYNFLVVYEKNGNKYNYTKKYVVYASNKKPNIIINVNKTYVLNKTDRIIIPVYVKYKNQTLTNGTVHLVVVCGDYTSMDNLKYDYQMRGFYGIYYVGNEGECTVKATYYSKDYATVTKEEHFKIIFPKKEYKINENIRDIISIIVVIIFVIVIVIFLRNLV